ncbi:unnamed protein product [Parnassius mnemosyne]|uniref:CCHC-type domain-containing protein n=1 Tax=Parnassius mnemosyne TaxID=213953 RepID=A0AAV1KNH2_9NEOP
MSCKSGSSGTSSAKSKYSKTGRGVSPTPSVALRKKVLIQNAATSGRAAEEELDNKGPGIGEPGYGSDSIAPSKCSYVEIDDIVKPTVPTPQDLDSEGGSSITMDIDKELSALGLCKRVRETEDEWSDGDSVVSDKSKRSSILPPAYRRAGISMDLATQRANEFLLSGKEALEKAGNMKKECKSEVHDCLQGLYETVLSLSDSRSRHRLAVEQERSRAAKELVRIERAHNKQLTEIQNLQFSKVVEAYEAIKSTGKGVEAIRTWLCYEMDEPIKAISKIQLEVHGLITKTQSTTISEKPSAHSEKCTENFTLLLSKIAELNRNITSLSQEVEKITNRNTDMEIKIPTPEHIISQPDPRLEQIIAHIQETKEIIQTYKSTNTPKEETQKEDIENIIQPVTSLIKNVLNEISDLKDCNTTQMAFQGNTGLGTELAITEIKDKINELQNIHKFNIPTVEANNQTIQTEPARRPTQSNTKSYAEVTSTPRYAMIVESIDPRSTCEDILKQVKKDVDPVELGIRVNKIAKLKNQRVVINCDSQQDRHLLKTAIRDTCDRLTVSTPATKNPQLRLVGVINDLDDVKLAKAITSQNRSLIEGLTEDQKAVKVIRRAKGRTREVINVILEVSPQIWNNLKNQKLRIGYQVVSCVDQSPLTQCYKCLSFNHKAKDCRNSLCCGYCAEGHDTREYQNRNSVPKCCNCIKAKRNDILHPAYSPECQEWQKWDSIARSSVSYC